MQSNFGKLKKTKEENERVRKRPTEMKQETEKNSEKKKRFMIQQEGT